MKTSGKSAQRRKWSRDRTQMIPDHKWFLLKFLDVKLTFCHSFTEVYCLNEAGFQTMWFLENTHLRKKTRNLEYSYLYRHYSRTTISNITALATWLKCRKKLQAPRLSLQLGHRELGVLCLPIITSLPFPSSGTSPLLRCPDPSLNVATLFAKGTNTCFSKKAK